MYLVPVGIMGVVYSVVTFTLVTRKIPGTVISSTISAQEKAKRKVIKMLIAVLVCFVVCWTPQQCMLLYDVFRPHDQVPEYLKRVKYAAVYLAYLNSAVNPILYGGFNDNFRRGFRDVFNCLLNKKPNNKVHPAAGGGRGIVKQGSNGAGAGGGGGNGTGGGGGDGPSTHDAAVPGPSTLTHTLPHLPTVSTRLTSQRFHITEAARTVALFGDPHLPPLHHRPSSASDRRRCRRFHSVNSDDTMDIAWHALQ